MTRIVCSKRISCLYEISICGLQNHVFIGWKLQIIGQTFVAHYL